MSYFPHYDKGDWKAICDVCGREFKASNLIRRWDGLMCCPQDWEIRHPQDFVRGVTDTQVVPWVRDEVSDTFIIIQTTSAVANLAVAGLAITNNSLGAVDPIPSSSFRI